MPSNNLRKLREAKGLSQLELANAVNLTQGAISYIERMGTTPRARIPNDIAKALGCHVSTVFPEKGLSAKSVHDDPLQRYGDKLVALLNNRSSSELGRIVTMLEAAFPR